MLQVEIIDSDEESHSILAPDDCVIGKGSQNEIRLNGWRIGKEHARLFKTPAGVLIEDMGAFSGVVVNGQRINDQYGPIKESDIIKIASYRIIVRVADEVDPHLHNDPSSPSHSTSPSSQHELLSPTSLITKTLEFEWRKRIHNELLETMDLRRHDIHGMTDDRLRNETYELIQQILERLSEEIPASLDRDSLCKQVLNEAVGLGPLEELLVDDSVTEVMVNRYDEIYIERAGQLLKHELTFTDDRAVMGVIERIVAPLGRRIDESSPMVDARLKDGSRVNAIIPPLALKGPCVTIRKFAKRKLTVEDLTNFGATSSAMAEFMRVCVETRKNVIVSGGTGSGKTTLLNILSNFIPVGERIVTVEDAAELRLHHAHLVSLEARPSNLEGKGSVTIRDLVKNTLRMRPDRIVVGECRGAEALDMLQAMNTGHEGSLTTLHANSPRDALARLETMVLMAGMELPLAAIREQIASAVDVIIQQNRFACGSRKITSIVEVTGMEGSTIQLQELFRFVNQGYCGQDSYNSGKINGYFTGNGLIPHFYEELRDMGRLLDISIFDQTRSDATAVTEPDRFNLPA